VPWLPDVPVLAVPVLVVPVLDEPVLDEAVLPVPDEPVLVTPLVAPVFAVLPPVPLLLVLSEVLLLLSPVWFCLAVPDCLFCDCPCLASLLEDAAASPVLFALPLLSGSFRTLSSALLAELSASLTL
jgi:hypothetical protein